MGANLLMLQRNGKMELKKLSLILIFITGFATILLPIVWAVYSRHAWNIHSSAYTTGLLLLLFIFTVTMGTATGMIVYQMKINTMKKRYLIPLVGGVAVLLETVWTIYCRDTGKSFLSWGIGELFFVSIFIVVIGMFLYYLHKGAYNFPKNKS